MTVNRATNQCGDCHEECAASCNGTVSTHARARTYIHMQTHTHTRTLYNIIYMFYIYLAGHKL